MTGSTEANQAAGGLAALKLPLALLAVVPVTPALAYLTGLPPVWVFVSGALGVAVLADWVRRSTEQLAEHVGPAIGGLLTISFGSLAEVILALFVLAEGRTEVVRAQITGSIIGTSLLGLGLAIVVGGIGRDRQHFKRERAGQLSSMLILVVIALLLPAVFDITERNVAEPQQLAITDEQLSIGVSVVLLALYGANLVYTLVTHPGVFASEEPRAEGGGDAWPLRTAGGVLLLGVTALAVTVPPAWPTDLWWVRFLGFPRLQVMILALAVPLVAGAFWRIWRSAAWMGADTAAAFAAAAAWNAALLSPYLSPWRVVGLCRARLAARLGRLLLVRRQS